MTEREEPDDKITVLFPGGVDRGESADSGEDDEPRRGGDLVEVDDDVDDDDEGQGADKVVHFDFQREATRRSPKPQEQVEYESTPKDEAKREVFERLAEEGMVMVTLDTREPGVDVPRKFHGLAELRLNFSYLFHIDDFQVDKWGVRASLSFQGKRYYCQVPWSSVFMLYSHETSEVVVFDPR